MKKDINQSKELQSKLTEKKNHKKQTELAIIMRVVRSDRRPLFSIMAFLASRRCAKYSRLLSALVLRSPTVSKASEEKKLFGVLLAFSEHTAYFGHTLGIL